MSEIEWTDAEREVMQATNRAHRMDNGQCTCGYDPEPGTPFVNDWGCHMAEKVVVALAPFVAERERQAAATALREAANLIGGADGPRHGVKMPDETEWAQWLHDRADAIEAQP